MNNNHEKHDNDKDIQTTETQSQNAQESKHHDVGEVLNSSEEIQSMEEQYELAKLEIKQLQEKIKTLTSVTATSQSQYLSLKSEMEGLQRIRDIEKGRDKVSAIVAVAKKFVILLQHMKQFLDHLTPELEENELIKGFTIIYKNFVDNTLADFGIKQIQSLGLTPDSELHEIVMMDTATESDITMLNSRGHEGSDFSSRIIREFEIGYYYMDGESRHIIKAAKVVVGE